MLAAAKSFYGRPYDIFFSFDNDAIYCSERPFRAWQKIGRELGKVQKIGDLQIGPAVATLISARWDKDPECKSKGYGFEACLKLILGRELISPARIAADPRLRKVTSTYRLSP